MTKGQAPSVGFAKPHYTMIPDEILDNLGGRPYPETLVLLYIARRTFGFGKQADAISLSQFTDGIKARDGRIIDTGCGVKGRSNLTAALKALEQRGEIIAERSKRGEGSQTTVYRLALRDDVVVSEQDQGSLGSGPGVVSEQDQGSLAPRPGVVSLRDPQKYSSRNSMTRSPLPPEGGPAPSSVEEGPDGPEQQQARPKIAPPPTPAPKTVDARPPLDLQSRARQKRAAKTNGWSEYPDRLDRLKAALDRGWKLTNPDRIDARQLELVPQAVAPDEAEAFVAKTKRYLKSVNDPQYLKSLRKWLEGWRDAPDTYHRPMNQAEINQDWLLKLPNGADLARQQLAEAQ